MKLAIAKIFTEILNEESIELVVTRNGKEHIGNLFFAPIDEKVVEEIKTIEIDDATPAKEVIETAFELINEFDEIKKFKDTLKSMFHWGYMNGVVDEYITL